MRELEETRSVAARGALVRDARSCHPEEECSVRTPFQRDRDRILHSKPFRRLKGKTQVFIDPAGDHYRTRMTHTLETTGIARVVARALRLNEDLAEAIGLGHDIGHPPFGHAGEAALDAALRDLVATASATTSSRRGSRERLNLTHEVVDGILTHTGPREPETLEGKIVRIVDRVAYINHDIDDAIRYGILAEADLPADELAVLGPTGVEAHRHARPRPRRDLGARQATSCRATSRRGDARAAGVHVRARLPRPGDEARARAGACDGSAHLRPPRRRGDDPEAITEFIAGMTDRFALDIR